MSYSVKDYAEFVVSAAKKNVGPIIRTVTGEPSFGSPWLFALVVLGLFRTAWSRQRLCIDGLLVVYALVFVLVLLTVQALWFRYFYAVLATMLFWAAKGADEVRDWSQATIRSIAGRNTFATAAGEGLKWLALLLVLLVSLRNVPYVSQFHESLNRERKEAGLWLARQAPGHKWVMDMNLQVAYYAGADLMYLPYADSDLALRYVVKRNPDYIVLTGGATRGNPYTVTWFQEGIPSRTHISLRPAPTGGEHIRSIAGHLRPRRRTESRARFPNFLRSSTTALTLLSPQDDQAMLNYVALGVFAAMLAAGQVFFKYAASSMTNKPVADGFLELAQTPTFYAAVALYGAATLLWVWILSRVPLSQAYQWVALAMSAVPIRAVVVFHERFDSS